MQRRFIVNVFWVIIAVLSIFTSNSIGHAAGTNVISITAIVLSKGNCRFNSSTAALNFGNLDPGDPVDKNATTTINFRCQANGNNLITFSISSDDGRYGTGPDSPRMRHLTQTSEYLPYTLTLSPTSGNVPKITDTPLTIAGTLRGVDYRDALSGDYSDRVVISIVS